METHRRKRVEIIVEGARAPRMIEMIEEQGATGYSVIPNLSGKGRHGVRGGEVLEVFDTVMIITITSEARARAILEAAHALLQGFIGIVSLSDVEIVRDDRF